METLKRCPSCGGDAELKECKPYAGKRLFRVACRECGFGTGDRVAAELAEDSWNTRYASKFALPVGCDGSEIDLGGFVTHAATGAVGKVASASVMVSLDDDMRLSAAEYCAEVLDCEEAASTVPMAAVVMKFRDVKRRLNEIGGL